MTDSCMAQREKQYRVTPVRQRKSPKTQKAGSSIPRVSSASDDQLNSFAAQNRSLQRFDFQQGQLENGRHIRR